MSARLSITLKLGAGFDVWADTRLPQSIAAMPTETDSVGISSEKDGTSRISSNQLKECLNKNAESLKLHIARLLGTIFANSACSSTIFKQLCENYHEQIFQFANSTEVSFLYVYLQEELENAFKFAISLGFNDAHTLVLPNKPHVVFCKKQNDNLENSTESPMVVNWSEEVHFAYVCGQKFGSIDSGMHLCVQSIANFGNMRAIESPHVHKFLLGDFHKKLKEVEMAFEALKFKSDYVPSVQLAMHPLVSEFVSDGMSKEDVAAIATSFELTNDLVFELQNLVSGWIIEIHKLTKLPQSNEIMAARELSVEIIFWETYQKKLEDLDSQLKTAEVLLIFELLKRAKRFHLTMGFYADCGIGEAMDFALKKNFTMESFPIVAFSSAHSLEDFVRVMGSVSQLLVRKSKSTNCHFPFLLHFLERITESFLAKLLSIFKSSAKGHSKMPPSKNYISVLINWDNTLKEIQLFIREVNRKRNSKVLSLKFDSALPAVIESFEVFDTLTHDCFYLAQHLKCLILEAPEYCEKIKAYLCVEDLTHELDQDLVFSSPAEFIKRIKNCKDRFLDIQTEAELEICELLRKIIGNVPEPEKLAEFFSKFQGLLCRSGIATSLKMYKDLLISHFGQKSSEILRAANEGFEKSRYFLTNCQSLPTNAINSFKQRYFWMTNLQQLRASTVDTLSQIFEKNWTDAPELTKIHADLVKVDHLLPVKDAVDEWLVRARRNLPLFRGPVFLVSASNEAVVLSVDCAFCRELSEIVQLFSSKKFNLSLEYVTFLKDYQRLSPYLNCIETCLLRFEMFMASFKNNSNLQNALLTNVEEFHASLTSGFSFKWELFLKFDSKTCHENRYFQFVENLNSSLTSLHYSYTSLQEYNKNFFSLIESMKKSKDITALLNLIQKIQLLSSDVFSKTKLDLSYINDEINQKISAILCDNFIFNSSLNSFEPDCFKNALVAKVDATTLSLSFSPTIEHAMKESFCECNQETASLLYALLIKPNSFIEKSTFYDILQPLIPAQDPNESLLDDIFVLRKNSDQIKMLFEGIFARLNEERLIFEYNEGQTMQKFTWFSSFVNFGDFIQTLSQKSVILCSKYTIDLSDVIKYTCQLFTQTQNIIAQMHLQTINEISENISQDLKIDEKNLDCDPVELFYYYAKIKELSTKNDNKVSLQSSLRDQITLLKSIFSDICDQNTLLDQIDEIFDVYTERQKRFHQEFQQRHENLKLGLEKIAQSISEFLARFNAQKKHFYIFSLDLESFKSNLLAYQTEFSRIQVDQNLYIAHSDEFGLPAATKIQAQINSAKEEFEKICSFWRYSLDVHAEFMRNISIKLQVADVKNIIQITQLLMQKLERNPQSIGCFEAPNSRHVAFLGECLELLKTSKDLKMAQLSADHWSQIAALLAIDAKNTSIDDLTVAEIVLNRSNQTPIKLAQKIKDILAVSNSQNTIADSLKRIQNFYEIPCNSIFKITFCKRKSIVTNIATLTEEASDHVAILESIKNSPYVSGFSLQRDALEKNVFEVINFLSSFHAIQTSCMQLSEFFVHKDSVESFLAEDWKKFAIFEKNYAFILQKMQNTKEIFDFCSSNETVSVLAECTRLNQELTRGLRQFVEQQRNSYPRFYFVGDCDLLAFFSASNVTNELQQIVPKLIPSVRALIVSPTESDEICVIEGLEACCGEILAFEKHIQVYDSASKIGILIDIEREIKHSLQVSLKLSLEAHASNYRLRKPLNFPPKIPFQICQLTLQILFSEILMVEPDDESNFESAAEYVNTLIDNFGASSRNQRKYQNILIELRRQLRDLQRISACEDVRQRALLIHYTLKFKLQESTDTNLPEVCVILGASQFSYSFEYLGTYEKIIDTKVVCQFYRSSLVALSQNYGGCLFGPSGTGKTESVKSLGHLLGRLVIVFNCNDSFEFDVVRRILKGVGMLGAWACFDEINRLDRGNLSAISDCISRIQHSLASKSQCFIEEDAADGNREWMLQPNTAMFVTYNPFYTGRVALPANIKALFRSFSMKTPDCSEILESLFFVAGFKDPVVLSENVLRFFNICQSQLSDQPTYDFSIRTMKAAIKNMRPESDDLVDGVVSTEILRCLYSAIAPRLVADDRIKLAKLIRNNWRKNENFAADAQSADILREFCQKRCYFWGPSLPTAANFILDLARKNDGIILYGEALSGKTTAYRCFKHLLKTKDIFDAITEFTIDPSTMSTQELFGSFDAVTSEWVDGLLPEILRRIHRKNAQSSSIRELFVVYFDGCLYSEWIESLNSVLDDNKMLTLANGERIALPSNCKLFFESTSTEYLTKATMSRCGMVYFCTDSLETNIFEGILHESPFNKLAIYAQITQTFNKFRTVLCAAAHLIHQRPASFKLTGVAALKQFFSVFFYFLSDGFGDAFEDVEVLIVYVMQLVFAKMLPKSQQKHLIELLQRDPTVSRVLMENESKLLLYPDFDSKMFVSRETFQLKMTQLKGDDSIVWRERRTFVATEHAATHHIFLQVFSRSSARMLLLCGASGAGKCTSVLAFMRAHRSAESRAAAVHIVLTRSSTIHQIVFVIEAACELCHSSGEELILLPVASKQLWVFIEEMNLPLQNKFKVSPPIAWINFVVENGGYWKDGRWVSAINIKFVGACDAPCSGDAQRFPLSAKLLKNALCVHVDRPDAGELVKMCAEALCSECSLQFVAANASSIAACIVAFVEALEKRSTSQFGFNVRDLMCCVYEIGFWFRNLASSANGAASEQNFLYAFVSAVEAVFMDRIECADLRGEAQKAFAAACKDHGLSAANALEAFCIANWPDGVYQPHEAGHLREILSKKLDAFKEEYSIDGFEEATFSRSFIRQICRIDQCLDSNGVHLLLLGDADSLSKEAVLFACWLKDFAFFEAPFSEYYSPEIFLCDVKEQLKSVFGGEKRVCFFVDVSNCADAHFYLDNLSAFLLKGDASLFFTQAELQEMNFETAEGGAQKMQSNFHLVIASPTAVRRREAQLKHDLHATPLPAAVTSRCRIFYCAPPSDEEIHAHLRSMLSDLPLAAQQKLGEMVTAAYASSQFDSRRKAAEFCRHLSSLYAGAKAKVDGEQRHFAQGLHTLDQSFNTLAELSANLTSTQTELKAKSAATTQKFDLVTERKHALEAEVAQANDLRSSLEQQRQSIATRRQTVDEALRNIEPELLEAKNQVQNIKKTHLFELKSLANPPDAIKLTLEAVCYLLGYAHDTWKSISAALRKEDFISSIVNFDVTNISDGVVIDVLKQNYFTHASFTYETVNYASKACGPLLLWVKTQVRFVEISAAVQPLKAEVFSLQTQMEANEKRLAEIHDSISRLTAEIDVMQQEHGTLAASTQQLQQQLAHVQQKFTKAQNVLSGLDAERLRWRDATASQTAAHLQLEKGAFAKCAQFSDCAALREASVQLAAEVTACDAHFASIFDEVAADVARHNSEDCQQLRRWIEAFERGIVTLLIDDSHDRRVARMCEAFLNDDRLQPLIATSGVIHKASYKDVASWTLALENSLKFGHAFFLFDVDDSRCSSLIGSVVKRFFLRRRSQSCIQLPVGAKSGGGCGVHTSTKFKLVEVSPLFRCVLFAAAAATATGGMEAVFDLPPLNALKSFCVTVDFRASSAPALTDACLNVLLGATRKGLFAEKLLVAKKIVNIRDVLQRSEAELLGILSDGDCENENELSAVPLIENAALIATLAQIKETSVRLKDDLAAALDAKRQIEAAAAALLPTATKLAFLVKCIVKFNAIDAIYDFSHNSLLFLLSSCVDAVWSDDCSIDDAFPVYESLFTLLSDTVKDEDVHQLMLLFYVCIISNAALSASNIEDFVQVVRRANESSDYKAFIASCLLEGRLSKRTSGIVLRDAMQSHRCVLLLTTRGGDVDFCIEEAANGAQLQTISLGASNDKSRLEAALLKAKGRGACLVVKNAHFDFGWLANVVTAEALSGDDFGSRNEAPFCTFRIVLTSPIDDFRHQKLKIPSLASGIKTVLMQSEPSFENIVASLCVSFHRTSGFSTSDAQISSDSALHRNTAFSTKQRYLARIGAVVHAIFKFKALYFPYGGFSNPYDFLDDDFVYYQRLLTTQVFMEKPTTKTTNEQKWRLNNAAIDEEAFHSHAAHILGSFVYAPAMDDVIDQFVMRSVVASIVQPLDVPAPLVANILDGVLVSKFASRQQKAFWTEFAATFGADLFALDAAEAAAAIGRCIDDQQSLGSATTAAEFDAGTQASFDLSRHALDSLIFVLRRRAAVDPDLNVYPMLQRFVQCDAAAAACNDHRSFPAVSVYNFSSFGIDGDLHAASCASLFRFDGCAACVGGEAPPTAACSCPIRLTFSPFDPLHHALFPFYKGKHKEKLLAVVLVAAQNPKHDLKSENYFFI